MTVLHHIALGARDVEVVARFYTGVFGLREIARHRDDVGELRSIWLDLGGAILMVERTKHERPHVDGVDAGAFLLAFDVSPADRAAMEEVLDAYGCPIEERTAFSSYARDPEGNRVAISHYPHCNETVAAYSEVADIYGGTEQAEDDPAWRASCRDLFLGALDGRRVLEIGCGPGTDAVELARAGCDVVATDGAQRFIEMVQDRYPNIEARIADFGHLPADLTGFDGLFAHSCLIHVERDALVAVLDGLRNALVDGGLFFGAMAQADVPSHTVPDWGGQIGNAVTFHYHRPEEIRQALVAAGFREIELHRLGWSEDSIYYSGPPAHRIETLGIEPFQVTARR